WAARCAISRRRRRHFRCHGKPGVPVPRSHRCASSRAPEFRSSKLPLSPAAHRARRTAGPAWVEFADTLPQRAVSFHASEKPDRAQSRPWGHGGRGGISGRSGANGYIRRMICKKCLVSGRVQGVFYRGSAAQRARELGVRGYARNLADGRVEVLACGEEEAVRTFVSWLWTGSSASQVTAVEVTDAPQDGAPAGFHTG